MTDTDELAGRLAAKADGFGSGHYAGPLREAAAALRALQAERDEARAEAHAAKVEMLEEWDRHLGTKLDLAKQAQEIAVLRGAVLYLGSAFSPDNLRKDVRETLDRARSLANTKGAEDDR